MWVWVWGEGGGQRNNHVGYNHTPYGVVSSNSSQQLFASNCSQQTFAVYNELLPYLGVVMLWMGIVLRVAMKRGGDRGVSRRCGSCELRMTIGYVKLLWPAAVSSIYHTVHLKCGQCIMKVHGQNFDATQNHLGEKDDERKNVT